MMKKVFISYSHKDDEWKNQLATHLKTLEIEGFYQAWDDAKIAPGSNWQPEIETALNQAQVAVMLISADHISLYKLPVTGDRLFGREKELKLLDDAWADCQTHILTLVAWGGVGKTALVSQWLNQLKTDNYRGAQKVYGWSFYSQGAQEGKQASADEFFQETLQWFGDAHPKAGRLCDAQGKMEEAAEHFRAAKKLIDETGYERRRKELRDN